MVGIWNNWNSPMFLVAIHNGTTSLETYLALNTINLRHSNLALGISSNGLTTYAYTHAHRICVQNLTAVLFISPKS